MMRCLREKVSQFLISYRIDSDAKEFLFVKVNLCCAFQMVMNLMWVCMSSAIVM